MNREADKKQRDLEDPEVEETNEDQDDEDRKRFDEYEFDKNSKWQVVSLGEMQQPGGVANNVPADSVTEPATPVNDVGQASTEQEVFIEKFVNYAVEQLNAGRDPREIGIDLAHSGCPPELVGQVLQQAEAQGQQNPFADDTAGDDAFAGVQTQNPEVGQERGSVPSMTASADPVSEIEEFIATFEELEPTTAHLKARIENLTMVRKACRQLWAEGKLDFNQQYRLDAISTDTQVALLDASEALSRVASSADREYVATQRKYEISAFDPLTYASSQWTTEQVQIVASEIPAEVQDEDVIRSIASSHNSHPSFADAVLAVPRKAPVTIKTAATETHDDGPAEALFM